MNKPIADAATLRAACDALGLENGYFDIWGNYREVSNNTAGVLLNALSIRTGSQPALDESITATEEVEWQRLAPPVITHHADQDSLVVEAHVDTSSNTKTIYWQLVLESGSEDSGRISIEACETIETRNFQTCEYRKVRFLIKPQCTVPMGYHTLQLRYEDHGFDDQGRSVVIVAPRRCKDVPGAKQGVRHWGLSVQLYSIRSKRNWGIGDFTDLNELIGIASNLGAAAIGINPLHALNIHGSVVANPYSPNSRHFLNILYLDVEAMEDYRGCGYTLTDHQLRLLAYARSTSEVDYATIVELKLGVTTYLYDHFITHHAKQRTERGREFELFCKTGGKRLQDFAIYEAAKHTGVPVSIDIFGNDNALSKGDPDDIEQFVTEHSRLIRYFKYLQWQADKQLNYCSMSALHRRMPIGLYFDLAIGCTHDSADVWAKPDVFAERVEIGAPADDFSPDGQCWGTAPLRPDALRAEAYETFIALLRDTMRYAGMIRIDHVMGLMRLFWVPIGGKASDGTYMRYPMDILLAITAIESQRNQCIVVGEDLGSVPDEMRNALWQWGVLSTRVFYFEKYWDSDHAFKFPEHYIPQSLTTVGSHDLPTLRGFWWNSDLDILSELNRFPSEEFRLARYSERREDRYCLMQRLQDSGLEIPPVNGEEPLSADQASRLAVALYTWLGRSPSQLLMVQPEDIFGVLEQVNVPGTVTEQPNWKRKLPVALEEWENHDALRKLSNLLQQEGRANWSLSSDR